MREWENGIYREMTCCHETIVMSDKESDGKSWENGIMGYRER